MNKKSLIFGLGLLCGFLTVPFVKGSFEVAKAENEIVDTGTFTVKTVSNGEKQNGFYFSLDRENAVPFDPGWQFTSYCDDSAVTIVSNGVSTHAAINIKKINTNTYYMCLLDADKQATENGYRVIANGTWSYTHTDSKIYKFTLNRAEFEYNDDLWSLNIAGYNDNELEKYDVLTLKDAGIPNLSGKDAFDYEGHNALDGASTVALSSDNTTGSMALKFYYSADAATADGKTTDIRLRGQDAWNPGYIFTFCTAWGPHGVILCRVNQNSIAGDIDFGFEPGKKNLVEVGVIDIKDTNKVWMYVKLNNKLVSSNTVDALANCNTARLGIYVCPTGNNATQHFESVEQEYTNVQNITENPIYLSGNENKGFRFTLSENSAPYNEDWQTRFFALDKDNISVNGVGSFTYGKHAIVKYTPTEYYVVFSDHGISVPSGAFISLEGVFNIYANGKTYAYRFPEAAFIYEGGSTYTQLNNPREDLISMIDLDVDYDIYDDENLTLIEETVLEGSENIRNAETLAKAYVAYVNAKLAIEDIAPNEEIAKAKLRELKEESIAALRNYVSLDNYTEDKQALVQQAIDNGVTAINNATNKTEVLSALQNAKNAIDGIESKRFEWEREVINQEPGYEAHLETYDVATLSDINHEKMEFATDGDGWHSAGESDVSNTFARSEENEAGNVIFQFKYFNNSIQGGKYGPLAYVRLRGQSYFGYRFDIGQENGDVSILRFVSDTDAKIVAFSSGALSPNVEHNVQIGAIDLKQFDRTWLFIKVDGTIVCNVFVDSIDFAVNPRIAFADSFAREEGQIAYFEDLKEGTTCSSNAIDGGRGRLNNIPSTSTRINFTLAENDLPFDSALEAKYYPTLKACIKVNNQDVANVNHRAIYKISETDYALDLEANKLSALNEGDEIVIGGVFAIYDGDAAAKKLISIRPTTMIYHENGYEYIATLDEVKADAISELQNYKDATLYSDENKTLLEQAIANGVTAINAATNNQEVYDALANAKEAIDSIETILQAYQKEAIAEVNEYKNSELDNYRDAQKTEIANIKAKAVSDINAATSTDAIDLIVLKAKQDINAVKTNSQLEEEELVEYKAEAKKEVQEYYGNIDLDAYSEENVNKINSLTTKALSDIEASTSIDGVRNVVETYKQEIAAINKENGGNQEHKTEKKGCGGSIIASTAIISIISVLGLTLISLKKKEDK